MANTLVSTCINGNLIELTDLCKKIVSGNKTQLLSEALLAVLAQKEKQLTILMTY